MCVGCIMKVSSIQSLGNANSTFAGRLKVQNFKTGVTKEYITNAMQDSMLRLEAKPCVPLFIGRYFIGNDFLAAYNSKPYIDALKEVANDDFIKDLPEIPDRAYFGYAMKPEKGYVFNIFDYFKVSHSYKL